MRAARTNETIKGLTDDVSGALLGCLSTTSDVTLPPNVDNDRLLSLLQAHGLLPRFFAALDQGRVSNGTDELRIRVRKLVDDNARGNLAASRLLASTIELANRADIDLLCYKGPVLALQLYGDVGQRQFVDLDLFVRVEQVADARDLFLQQGYASRGLPTGWRFDRFLKTQREFEFVHTMTGQQIDLQWAITPRYFRVAWDTAGLWSRLSETTVGGTAVPTFGLEDLSLILCVHGCTHLWERLGWVADLAELVRKDVVDWHQVIADAERTRTRRMVGTSLALCQLATGVALPLAVRPVTDESAKELASRLLARAIRSAPDLTREGSPFHLIHVKLRDRAVDQIAYAADLAITPTSRDWEFIHLPERLAFVYLVARPVRLLFRSAGLAFRRLGNVFH